MSRTPQRQLEEATRTARIFLEENSDLFGLDEKKIASLRIERRFSTEHNGMSHVFLQRSIAGLELFQAVLAVHLDRSGAVISASGELFPNIPDRMLAQPALTPEQGLRQGAVALGAPIAERILRVGQSSSTNQAVQLLAGLARPVDSKLVYFPLTASEPRLAWQFFIWLNDSPDAYLVLVDARDGTLLYRYNLTSYDENPLRPHGLVFTGESPTPHNPYTGVDSPASVPQQDVPFRAGPFLGMATFAPSDPHYDWWAGATANGLISNNTDTHLDRDATQNAPDLPRLEVANGNFSFPADLTVSPLTDATAEAAQVNLFYWVNRYHDILYSFGFNESAGNFQTNTFGLGGLAGDAVQGDAQDGSGFNNANFSTPPDGSAGRVQMYLWNAFNPNRDGDFDQGVIIHELTHGLSNRLVGNATGLSGVQARGMGEGWSDYFAMVLLRTPSENPDGSYGVGQYVTNRYSRGIRRYPYSTSLLVNPLTFRSIAGNTESHAVGEIWCSLLWEMRRLLIERYGFEEGQRQSIQLVVDGLKLTPTSPTFLDARDAIMLADRVNNAGANLCLIWKAFAKRGAGLFAESTDSNDAAPVESFTEASYCNDTGTLTFDRNGYLPGERVAITLGDRNAPTAPTVEVRSVATGDSLTIKLTGQTGIPGSYTATFPTSSGRAITNDGVLQLLLDANDQIQLTYVDTSVSGGGAGEAIANAPVVREAIVIADNIEGGGLAWIPSGTWLITGTQSASSTHSWIVRGAGNDLYLTSIALTSPTIDLSLFSDVTLNFAQSHELLNGFNYGVIEYSTDDGATWARTRSFTGTRTSFQQASVRLLGLDGQQFARVRFVLQNASTSSTNFWAVDDISIIARSASAIAIPPAISESPAIESVVPAYGPPVGGTLVRINGTNFTDSADTVVSFDGLPASETNVLGETTLTTRIPAHVAGPVMVRISTRRGSSARAGAFTYFLAGAPGPTPKISELFPVSGSNRGGTLVTLFGTGFTPESIVTFGSSAAQTVFVDEHTLRCTTGAYQGLGTVGVQVRNGPQQVTMVGGYTYTAPTPPSIELLSPQSPGTIFAGSAVSIAWRSSDDRALTRHRAFLQYQVGQGSLQTEIASDLPGTSQSFNWQMPLSQTPTAQARIHVIATDDEGAEAEAMSASPLTVAQRWERTRALPTSLQRIESASDGTALYVFGGRGGATDTSTVTSIYRYDPATNLWVNLGLSPMPVGLSGGEAAFLAGRIYIPGGSSVSGVTSAHYAYDIAGNSWVQGAPSPAAVTLYSATPGPDGRLFLTGGSLGSGAVVTSARSYDPMADVWIELPPMSIARSGHRSAFIEGKLYVAGGSGASGGLTSCEVFDPATAKWSSIANLSIPRSGSIGVVTVDPSGNPLWLLAGGTNPATGALLGSETYDVRNNRWIQLDNSYSPGSSRAFLGSGKVGDYFYAVGGANPTQSIAAAERLRVDSINTIKADAPPALAVADFVPAVAGEELRIRASASDIGASVPVTISVTGLPSGAVFSSSQASANSTIGYLTWTPSVSDVGKTFIVRFTASDGQLSDSKSTRLTVVDAKELTAVNAADYHDGPLAADSIAAAFGTELAVRSEAAQAVPIPLELAGTSVFVAGRPAELLFVSPQQVNFVVPASIAPGPATIIVRSGTGRYSVDRVTIAASTPAIFTTNQNGTGAAAALATRDGVGYQSAPFDIANSGPANILVLFGTGFRHAVALNPDDANGVAEAVAVTIDGKVAQVHYAGAQGTFAGLDQLNIEFPVELAGGPQRSVEVRVMVNGVSANNVLVEIR